MSKDLMSSLKATFYGLAIGDAMGAPVEFKEKGSFEIVEGYRSGGKFNLDAGEWTDDTAMALCLAESLIGKSRLDKQLLLDLFVKWLFEGHNTTRGKAIGIGKQTFKVLSNYRKNGELISPDSDSKYSGNGALMRMAPVAIKFYDSLHDTREYAVQSTEVTHSSPECIQTSYLFGGILNTLVNQASKRNLIVFIQSHKGKLNHPSLENLIAVNVEKFDQSNSGYAPLSLEAALHAFFTTDSFREGMLKVVNNGMDSDTVGAIYGQIAGAYYGIESIPNEWLQGLKKKGVLDECLAALI